MDHTNTTSVKLIVIQPNNFEFEKDSYYNQIEKLTEDLNKHIEVRDVKFEDMMETIVNAIKLTPELVGETSTFYETSTNIYQMCHVGKEKEQQIVQEKKEPDPKSFNKLASYLFGEEINGTVILLNSRIKEDRTCTPDDITLENFTEILYSKFVHKGVFIKVDQIEPVIEYDYFAHPLEYYTSDEKDYLKYKLVELDFLGFSLAFFVEVNPENKQVNKRATRIMGKQPIFGDVIMLTKTPHEFHDLDLSLLNKILKLSYGSIASRELLDEEKEIIEKDGELPLVTNRYYVLEKRYNNHRKICNSCQEEILKNKLICGGCYRAIYHNEECQKSDWNSHKLECLYNK
jgi:hypothetical protein